MNIAARESQLGAAASSEPPLPRFAQIEPIGRCNLACKMCTVNHRGDEVGEMPLERFRELLDQMPQLQELHLQGLGEPMLHPRFFDMVELAAARGVRVSANTNLTLLTPQRAHRCITSGLAALSVSLDGATAAVYEDIRRKASFAKVIRNLGRLVDERDAAGSALEVRGVMVLMRSNLEDLPALVRLLHAHRVPELLVQRLSNDLHQPDLPARYIPIRSYVEDAELAGPDLGRAAAVFAESRSIAHELGLRLHLPRLSAGSEGPRCTWPSDGIYITASGDLLPCCMVATADRATFGKVFTREGAAQGGLAARWHGEPAQAFRHALAGADPPTVCRSCALYHGTF
nr:radical SAM/SPASM domain-containing protein [Piscinibacter sp. XHJ-5]